MPDHSWPAPLVITLAIVAAALGVGTALGTNLIMSLRKLRRHGERQTAELARRLRHLESRIQQADAPQGASPGPRALDLATGRSLSRTPEIGLSLASASLRREPQLRQSPEAREAPILIAIPDLAARDPEPGDRTETELSQRHGEAWTLAAAGASPAEIARQTGQPIGEVEVIVGLYRQLHGSRGATGHARPL
jgi:hypothetical protein